MKTRHFVGAALSAMICMPVLAQERYTIDPDHTYPSFEAPHIQGISVWRGKFNKTGGHVVLDRARQTGSVDITVDIASINFGHDELNKHALAAEMFDVNKYPTATYKANAIQFKNKVPVAVNGQLTLHGVTRAVPLKINRFKCITHPMLKVEVCGADLSGELDRSVFGVGYAADLTGSPKVKLAIQVEALKDSDVLAKQRAGQTP